MATKPQSKAQQLFRVVEILIALFLLLAMIELLLIQRSSSVQLPEVKLVERTEESLIVQLPAGTTTNATPATSVAGQPIPKTNQPEAVKVVRTVPPLLAFENVRRWLGLLGPRPNDTVTAYRHLRREKTVELPGVDLGKSKQGELVPAADGSPIQVVVPKKDKAETATQPVSSTGEPFRISLP